MPRFCTKCGAALSENDPFCGKCGSPVQGLLAQPALSVGQPQAAVHAPMSEPTWKRPDVTTNAVFMPLSNTQSNIQPSAVPSNSGPSAMRVLAVWILLGAIELGMTSMLFSFIHELKQNVFYEKIGIAYTSDHLLDLAYGAGKAGTFWGAVLGGVGGWIKTLKDRRSRRT